MIYRALKRSKASKRSLWRTAEPLAGLLAEVCRATCDCVFEETNAQTDEATAAQIIALLGLAVSN